jgi:hypothetical protein
MSGTGAPHWKELLEQLRSQGHQSSYLDRLQARVGGLSRGHRALEMEILQEMASSLGRSEDKVNFALLQLELCEREITALEKDNPQSPRLPELIERFNQLRQAALDARRDLMIHREAVGFRRNDGMHQLYPIPPRR